MERGKKKKKEKDRTEENEKGKKKGKYCVVPLIRAHEERGKNLVVLSHASSSRQLSPFNPVL